MPVSLSLFHARHIVEINLIRSWDSRLSGCPVAWRQAFRDNVIQLIRTEYDPTSFTQRASAPHRIVIILSACAVIAFVSDLFIYRV